MTGRGVRPRFFIDAGLAGLGHPSDLAGAVGREITLNSGDAHHARRVLRSRAGEGAELVLEPGGRVLEGVFVEVGDAVVVRVEAVAPAPPPARADILLVQGLPEPRKVDEIVEKGTEVGVDSFLVVPAAGSPAVPVARLGERATRWTRVAREAARQSRQLKAPRVEVASSLGAARERAAAEGRLSIVLDPWGMVSLAEALDSVSPAGPRGTSAPTSGGAAARPDTPEDGAPPLLLALWVGPEGGWSDDERAAFAQAGMASATLGRRVLRTETAGPVAAAVCRFALRDW